MIRPGKWRQTAAQVIYRGYPDQDLLPIIPPQPREMISAFAIRAQAAGDTLFLFLCREANDAMDAHEYVAQLDSAIRDIEHVRDAFMHRGRAGPGPSKRTTCPTRVGATNRT